MIIMWLTLLDYSMWSNSGRDSMMGPFPNGNLGNLDGNFVPPKTPKPYNRDLFRQTSQWLRNWNFFAQVSSFAVEFWFPNWNRPCLSSVQHLLGRTLKHIVCYDASEVLQSIVRLLLIVNLQLGYLSLYRRRSSQGEEIYPVKMVIEAEKANGGLLAVQLFLLMLLLQLALLFLAPFIGPAVRTTPIPPSFSAIEFSVLESILW